MASLLGKAGNFDEPGSDFVAKVIIIGAGMGGMACAARLRVKGHEVLVIEQNETWGGKLGTASFEAHKFDTGPSLLTLPAVYRDLFLKTGKPLEDSIEIVDLDRAFRYQFADGTVLNMPGAGIAKCADAIGDALGGQSSQEWRAFMHRAAQMWAATRKPFLENELAGWKSLASLSWRLNDLRTIAPSKSLRTLAEHYLSDPRLISLVDRYATYTGSDPRQAPAALATIPYIEQNFGAYHVAGGLRSLGAALYERCLTLGVKFTFQSDVTSIVGESKVQGVTLASGEYIPAEIVVANADASTVYQNLLSSDSAKRVKPHTKSLKRNTQSLSGYVLLLALNEKTPELAHHNVFFPSNYNDEFDSIFGIGKKKVPVPDPTIYVCNPNDSAMSPPDGESWFVLVNAPRHEPNTGVDWSDLELKENYQKVIISSLSRSGFDVTDRIKWTSASTPAELETRTRAPGGSIYGSSSNGMRSAFMRPTNTTKIEGLFLVGGSAHPGGGLPLVAMSARIVAERIGRAN